MPTDFYGEIDCGIGRIQKLFQRVILTVARQRKLKLTIYYTIITLASR